MHLSHSKWVPIGKPDRGCIGQANCRLTTINLHTKDHYIFLMIGWCPLHIWPWVSCAFQKKVPRDFFGHLILRAGLYNSIYHYENRSKSVIENGVSSGIGIKFGTTGNQIDIGYSYGIRTGLPTGNETLQRLSVGVSIGDIWFVKRREL